MKDLGTLVLSLPRIPSPRIGTANEGPRNFGSKLTKLRIGTSHEGLRDFGSEFTKNTLPPELELLMEVLGTLVLGLPRITPPLQNWNFSWRI